MQVAVGRERWRGRRGQAAQDPAAGDAAGAVEAEGRVRRVRRRHEADR